MYWERSLTTSNPGESGDICYWIAPTKCHRWHNRKRKKAQFVEG